MTTQMPKACVYYIGKRSSWLSQKKIYICFGCKGNYFLRERALTNRVSNVFV